MWWWEFGATLQMTGTRRESASMSFIVNSTPASCAMASRCRTVFDEPPIAMSIDMAFRNAFRVAIERGSTASLSLK